MALSLTQLGTAVKWLHPSARPTKQAMSLVIQTRRQVLQPWYETGVVDATDKQLKNQYKQV